ncbi:MAG: T9SS type A sorting domain-containing protein [Bacteroidota bacterium]
MRSIIISLGCLCLLASNLTAQNLNFSIGNKTSTNTYLTFDVLLSSDVPFKLGSGQVYFNFNPIAFGAWIHTNSNVSVSFPDGSVLNQQYLSFLPIYNNFILNDNTGDRFSFSWQQAFSSGAIETENINNTPVLLFQVRMNFEPGGSTQPDDLCFEAGDLFDDQTFTACGPTTATVADCFSEPGMQLIDDLFTCDVPLPIELLDFRAEAQADFTTLLQWQTALEINNDFFTVERAFDGINFIEIARISGRGNSQEIHFYKTVDDRPRVGINYYRLKQTDFDGSFSFSEIRSVSFKQDQPFELHVFPNPTTVQLNIRLNASLEQGQILLFNSTGQLVKSQLLEANAEQAQLQLNALPGGIYWLSIETGGQHFQEKIIVLKE